MKNKKMKNIFSLLLAVSALTGSNLVNALPPVSNPDPASTTSKAAPTSTTSAKSKQIVKAQNANSTALVKHPKTQQLTNTTIIGPTTFSSISSQATIPFTCDKNNLNIPIALQKSTMHIMVYRLDMATQKYVKQMTLTTAPNSKVPLPFHKLDCTQEYKCIVSITQNPEVRYSGIVHSCQATPSSAKAEKKSPTESTTTSTSQALTTKSATSTALTKGERLEIVGTFNITQKEILTQQNAVIQQNIQNCLKAYKLWHTGKATADCLLKYYKPLATDPTEADYTLSADYLSHIDTKFVTIFEQIANISEVITNIKHPDVLILQDDIKEVIEELIADATDKSKLYQLLEQAVTIKN